MTGTNNVHCSSQRVFIATLVVENMRGKMLQLWKSLASGEATVAQMILYPNAAALSKLEIPELLSLLPDIEKKDILELGAGIGQVLCAIFCTT